MRIKIFALMISVLFILGLFGVALAQSTNIDWEDRCASGNLELSSVEGSVLVRCLLGDVVEPTATLIPPPTETISPTATLIPTLTQIPPTPTLSPTLPPVSGNGIVVDHTSIALFDQIPIEYINAAREIPMMFSDRSVGQNMNDALDCLASPSWSLSPSRCRKDYADANQILVKTYTATDFVNGNVPDLILFPGGSAYNRSNWTYADCQGTWDVMTDLFINSVAPAFLSTKNVLSCQFSYLNVSEGSTIMEYFNTDLLDLESFIAQHPDKNFVFWTTSLARTIGTRESTEFNAAMRQYAISNDKIFMDMADIISHDRNGNECLDSTGRYPVICRDYTSELNGGHLGSVSGGQIQMGKAFWVLMAQIAGWTP